MTVEQQFFCLLQLSLGKSISKDVVQQTFDWDQLYEISKRHALIGVTFRGIRVAKENNDFGNIDTKLFLKWYSCTEKQKSVEKEKVSDAIWLSNTFKGEGFDSCILKGISMGDLYFNGLSRTYGDTDIWLMPNLKQSLTKRRKVIFEYCKNVTGVNHVVYHNVSFPVRGKSIEVHFTPSWMFSPFSNSKLQAFFETEWKKIVKHKKGFFIPSQEMNEVFILVHIFRHLFGEGIGLRQLLDYYFVLINSTTETRIRSFAMLKSLSMEKFVGATMYVLKTVFSLSDKYFLCAPNEKEGRFLLSEICQAGNFGHYDDRISHSEEETLIQLFYNRSKRNLRFLKSYPSEVLWCPIWKIWHYCWRKINGWD